MDLHNLTISDYFKSEHYDGSVVCDEPMSKHTSYKVGGPAKYFARVNNLESLKSLIEICHHNKLPWIVIGSGTNLLVSDSGYEGVVVKLDGKFKEFNYDPETSTYTVGGACLLSKIVNHSYKNGLAGLEFGVGTPGTIGGAIRMNAGTAACGVSSAVQNVVVLHEDGCIETISVDDIQWGYRTCSLSKKDIVLKVELKATEVTDQTDIMNMRFFMDEKLKSRKKTQPQNVPTCGSVFKNPAGDSAGRLIEAARLKGRFEGGAKISEIHANFIENSNNANASDIAKLIQLIQKTVKDKFDVELNCEVKFLGFDEEVDIFK